MNRTDLVARLAARHRLLSEADFDLLVKTILESMSNALKARERVEIRGFGSFFVRYRPARMGRDPRSGAAIRQDAMYRPCFKAGKRLRNRTNQAGGAASSPTGSA